MSTEPHVGLVWLAAAIASGAAAAVIALMLAHRWPLAIDQPNERSLHTQPVPRTGGLGLLAGLLCAALVTTLLQGAWPWPETVLAAALAAVSLIDDQRSLSVRVRLFTHLTIAVVYAVLVSPLVSSLVSSPALSLPPPLMPALLLPHTAPGWQGVVWLLFAALCLVTAINFYNFMDGANGMAGGMACIGFGAYAWAAWPGNPALAALSLAVAGAAAGFLPFNLKGRIFMGDAGSVPLGFLAGAVGLNGWHTGLWPLWFPALLFAPFALDATVTLVRRMLRGEKFWLSHREHYYQRVVLMGATHGQLAAGEFALMLACAGAALWARSLEETGGGAGPRAVFATIGALFLVLMLLIDARWKRLDQRQ